MAVAVRELRFEPGIQVTEYVCNLGPRDTPFDEQHRATCVAFVRRGGFSYRSSHGTAALGVGAALLGNAGWPYVCRHDVPGGDRCLSFSYAPEVVEQVAEAVGAPPRFRRPGLPPAPAFAALSAQAAAARGCAPALEEVAYQVLAVALAVDADLDAPQPSPADERRALETMSFLDARAAEPLTLKDSAARAGLTPFHFLRAFRRAAGTTPHQYLVGARLRRAAALLLGTELPVTEVAFQAGFGDLSNFIRTFRRAAGCAPRAFRRGASVHRVRTPARR